MRSYVCFAREALDSLGVSFRELPGYRFARFVTESVSKYDGLVFYVLVSVRLGIVKIVAYSPDLQADDASGPFQGTAVPQCADGKRRGAAGFLVGCCTLRKPESVESIVAGLEVAARALIGDPPDFTDLRRRPSVARRGLTESCDELSANHYSYLEK